MQKDKKKHAGVHIDNVHALIIATDDKEPVEYMIHNKVNAEHSTGNDHTMNNAKQSDTLKFFKSVSGLLLNYDELLIFGAGKAQEQFKNFLMEDAHFKTKTITIDTADSLTGPQMIAKVRDFYSAN